MTTKEFLEEHSIPEQYAEEQGDKLLIRYNSTCEIRLFKRMLENDILAGTVHLEVAGEDTHNSFCIESDKKIPIGHFVCSKEVLEEFPPREIGELLDLKQYSNQNKIVIANSARDLNLLSNETDFVEIIGKSIYD